jgi:hypothetical protein
MKSSASAWVSLFAIAVASIGCGSPPPPVQPEPTAEPTAEPPPPPAPKCESLDEGCKAKTGTAAKIAGSNYVFAPPKGWLYARLDKGTVAQIDAKGSVMVLVGYEPDVKAPAARLQRDAKLAELAELVSVQLPVPKALPLKANEEETKDGVKKLLWQRDQAKRGEEPGALLVLAREQSGRVLLGFGFVPDSDSSGADKSIMSAFDSIEKGADSSEGEGKPSSDKDSEPRGESADKEGKAPPKGKAP